MDWRDRALKIMKDRGFRTRNDLCIKAGISAGSLNMALNGTHELKLSTMGKLADALDTTTRWLLYGDDTVEARQVPLLRNRHIAAYILAGEVPENCDQVQIRSNLKVSDQAYAWKNFQDDMMPVFRNNDILIIDPCSPDELQENQSICYMVASGHCEIHTDKMSECLKRSKSVRFYVSNIVNLSSRLHFQSLHPSCTPELFTFPAQKSGGQFNIPIGLVVQLIRTFVRE